LVRLDIQLHLTNVQNFKYTEQMIGEHILNFLIRWDNSLRTIELYLINSHILLWLQRIDQIRLLICEISKYAQL